MPKLCSWGGLFTACLWLLVSLGAAPVQASPPAPLVLSGGETSAAVVAGIDYLVEEPGEQLTREQVLEAGNAARWQRYAGRHLNLVLQKRPVWVRFAIENRSTHTDWLLNLNSPLLEDVRFEPRDPVSGAWLDTQRGGTEVPDRLKLMRHNEPVFRLYAPAGHTTTVLLRVHTESSFVMPMTVWSPPAFDVHRFDTSVAMGGLFGILVVTLFYNASLFAFTRDRSYFIYSLYLLSIVLYELAVTGAGPLYLWGSSPWLLARGYEFFGVCSFLLATLFFRQFLDLKSSPAVHVRKINTVLLVYFAAATVLSLVWQNDLLFYSVGVVGLISGPIAIYSSIVLIRLRVRAATYFAIAWLAIVIGSNVTLLALYGVIESSWLTANGQHVGFVIETVLLSIALADRIKHERRQRERAQRESLALTATVQREREEKYKAQAEALEIQARAKRELEQRVADRTAEVERAMSKLEVANVELARLSVTDALTRVHNRRYFDEVLQREHERSARSAAPLALLLADLDHFKNINDKFGHLAGDECLRLVAAALRQVVGRSTDLIARYGGEEFAVVLPGTAAGQAEDVAERVRAAVESIMFTSRGERVPLSVSIGGVAKVAPAESTVADFIAEADAALYRAKGSGRNRVAMAEA